MRGREINWAQAYERRMRRFNLEVILVGLIALKNIDRIFIDRVGRFFTIASPMETAPVRKVVSIFYHGPPREQLGVFRPMR